MTGHSQSLFDAYRGKRVLVTGHTGFKGSWLALWLKQLGADVLGFSLYLPSEPCNYIVCDLQNLITHVEGNIRDEENLRTVFLEYKPDMVFHLAAQPIVRNSFEEPKLTFETNLMGTVNVLECIRKTPSVRAGVMITSDKCYENMEWARGYREDDRLGGKDPYSASKACAEIAISSYIRSFFAESDTARIASVRAGNVIGGGDWAKDRIVPDCIKAIASKERLEIRNSSATRPWQHVLEPLSGYLWLGACLLDRQEGIKGIKGEAFNFGPSHDSDYSVKDLMAGILKEWGANDREITYGKTQDRKESTLLKLNCDKASNILGWRATMSFKETICMTVDWYRAFYEGYNDMRALSISHINKYSSLASERGLRWTK